MQTARAELSANLTDQLLEIIAQQNLTAQRIAIKQMATTHNISELDCAAALLYMRQSPITNSTKPIAPILKPVKTKYRLVRYRLNIGSEHQIQQEQIEQVLVQESGVDKKRIGKIDIRHNYTLVELPEGMPADIFQILSEATIGDQKLAIKRIKSNRKLVRNS